MLGMALLFPESIDEFTVGDDVDAELVPLFAVTWASELVSGADEGLISPSWRVGFATIAARF